MLLDFTTEPFLNVTFEHLSRSFYFYVVTKSFPIAHETFQIFIIFTYIFKLFI